MMRPFDFQSGPAIRSEWGAAARLGALLAERFDERRVLLVTDRVLVEAGLVAPAVASLREAGFALRVFDAVVPDPPESAVLACAEAGRGCDIVVGLGGGSSLDVAKLAAVMLRSDQPLGEMYGIDRVRGGRAPLVLVPTTAGTGSEVTNISIVTTGEAAKAGIVARQLFADLAILDAELTLALPPVHTAATGIDAMVHAIEAYTGRYRKNPVSDALAREALRLLYTHLLTACRDGRNREAREGMLLGAALAGQAFANSPVAAVHALAYPIGGRHKVPHGLSNALMLGPVLRFNLPAAASLYAELAGVIGAGGESGDEARARRFAETMAELLRASRAPARLRDVGIAREDLPALARDAMGQGRLLVNNPREVGEADALRLYEEAF